MAMTLEQFVAFLRRNLGASIKAADTVREVHLGIKETILDTLSKQDLETAMALRPIVLASLHAELKKLTPANFDRRAQLFLQGAPPDWIIAASDVPVDLKAGRAFGHIIWETIANGSRLAVVLGMAGSGKSTLAMRTVLKFANKPQEYILYELSGEARSFSRVFSLLQRLHPNRRVLLYLNDLALYGDSLAEDLETISGNEIVVVATARLGEWHDRFQRHLGAAATTFELARFDSADFEPLADRLLRYVPAPGFRKAEPEERLRRFKQSRSQLLIALREITESKRFDEVIEDEWGKIEDRSSRDLFYISGTATIARVGIASHMAASIYRNRYHDQSFDAALTKLSGIVIPDRENRLRVRHEVYAEHVFDIEPLSNFLESAVSILDVLSHYESPLTAHLTRNDALLFRWLLNSKSLYNRCKKKGNAQDGLLVYEKFEKAFELDGHFWLQYGLYCRKLGKYDRAMTYLNKSVEAYPQNPFAIHALADLKLLVAADLSVPTVLAQSYIEEAVAGLIGLDARSDVVGVDIYPIVTLGTRHLQALISRGLEDQARAAAKPYFERAQELGRRSPLPVLEQLKRSLLLYHSTGDWVPVVYEVF
jgi:tetratricopeptide (TPR) repeat protein